jgi:alkylhydroperoxidase family enzyme
MAQGAGTTPNAVADEDFDEMKKHFDEDQIVELVAAVCLFGWLNRWNDTMATDLETRPMEFGQANLVDSGWEPGKHV